MAFTFGLPWTILAMTAAPSLSVAAFYLLAYLLLRSAVYLTVGVWGLGASVVQRYWWLAPFRDAANFAVWAASFFSSRILRRGLEFRAKKGQLIPLWKPRSEPALNSYALHFDNTGAAEELSLTSTR